MDSLYESNVKGGRNKTPVGKYAPFPGFHDKNVSKIVGNKFPVPKKKIPELKNNNMGSGLFDFKDNNNSFRSFRSGSGMMTRNKSSNSNMYKPEPVYPSTTMERKRSLRLMEKKKSSKIMEKKVSSTSFQKKISSTSTQKKKKKTIVADNKETRWKKEDDRR